VRLLGAIALPVLALCAATGESQAKESKIHFRACAQLNFANSLNEMPVPTALCVLLLSLTTSFS
jgi:ABC-type Co2+ transport system permease subunit